MKTKNYLMNLTRAFSAATLILPLDTLGQTPAVHVMNSHAKFKP